MTNSNERARQEVVARSKRNHETSEQVKAAVEVLSRAVNVMGQEAVVAQALADALRGEHRTLQQGIVRAITQAMVIYGREAATDLRNKAAVELCQELTPVIQSKPLPFV